MKTRMYDFADDLKRMIEVDKMTQGEVARSIGVHTRTIEDWCKRLHLETQRTGPRSGNKHKGWKGGRVKIAGYWHIFAPNHPFAVHNHKYVAEHRLLMEQKLGRYLTKSEVVHHIDGDKENNSLDNLIVFQTNAEHLRYELSDKTPRKIDVPRPEPKRKLSAEQIDRHRKANREYKIRQKSLKYGAPLNTPPIDHRPS